MAESLRDLVVSLSLNTENFTRNIKSVNKQIQEAESYFKLAAAGVEGFENTTEGLTAKLSTLERRLQLQKDVVTQYERALEQATSKLTECYNRQTDYAQRLDDARQRQSALGDTVSQKSGISLWHGPHQLAQKFSTIGLPKKLLSFTGFPSLSMTSKSGAMMSSGSSFAEVSAASVDSPSGITSSAAGSGVG